MSEQLAAYLARLALAAAPPPDPEGLAAIQRAHRLAIPFENLDIHLGRDIRIDADSVFDKLVTRRRGGYCFEQNRLYSDMLAAIGIAHRPLLGRVRLRTRDGTPPRTHVLLLAEFAGRPWIADVGFGGAYIPPLPLVEDTEAATPDGARHRLRRSGGGLAGEWLLERAAATGDWQPQYSFDLAHVAPDDLEQANHWTSTRPGTRFTTSHIASIALPDGYAALTDRRLTVSRCAANEERDLDDPDAWRAALAETFTLALDEAETAALPLWRVS